MTALAAFIIMAFGAFGGHFIAPATAQRMDVLEGSNVASVLLDMIQALESKDVLLVTGNNEDGTLMDEMASRHDSGFFSYSIYSVTDNKTRENMYPQPTLPRPITKRESKFQVLDYQKRKLKNADRFLTIYLLPFSTTYELMEQAMKRYIFQRHLMFVCYGSEKQRRGLEKILAEPMKVLFLESFQRGKAEDWSVYYSQARAKTPNKFIKVNTWTAPTLASSESGQSEMASSSAAEDGGKHRNDYNSASSFRKVPIVPGIREVYGDFEGRVLRKPVLTAEPYVKVEEVDEDGTVTKVSGRDINIVLAIGETLNFGLHFFEPKHRSWGSSFNAKGQFPGMVGTIYRRVWIALGAFFCASGMVLYLFSYVPAKFDSSKMTPRTVVGCYMITYKAQLNQSVGSIQGDSKRIFFISWVLFALLVTVTFSGNLTSFYTNPGLEKSLNSLEELLSAMQEGDMFLGTEIGSSTESSIRNGDGILSEIWALMMKDEKKNLRLPGNTMGIMRVLEQPNYAWVGGRGLLTFAVNKIGRDKFHINRDLFISPKFKGVVLQKGSPYLDLVDAIVMRLFEGGLLDKWMQDEYWKLQLARVSSSVDENDEEEELAISLEGLVGAFLILGGGYIVSGAAFICEIFLHLLGRK